MALRDGASVFVESGIIGRLFRSGRRCPRESATLSAVAAYVAKYATKSADASGTLDRSLFCRPCQGRGATLLPHGTPLPCTACDGTGQVRPLPRLAVARHVRQMIRTCWELGKLPEFANLMLCKWAHMLGFRGHFSTTLGALRDARRAWRTEQALAHADLPEHDPATTLIVGHWDYIGSGKPRRRTPRR